MAHDLPKKRIKDFPLGTLASSDALALDNAVSGTRRLPLPDFLSQAKFAASTARVDYYVAPGGSDSAVGSSAAPLATLDEALRRANRLHVAKDPIGSSVGVAIHLAAGAYTWSETLGPAQLHDSILIVGDALTQLVAPAAAQAGSGSGVVVTGGGLSVNAHLGKTIEILTGAAAGNRRTIRNNTATDIVPLRNFSAAVAAGDQYRIVEPAAEITVPGDPDFANPTYSKWRPLVAGLGGPVGALMQNSTVNVGLGGPALTIANVRFVPDPTPAAFTSMAFVGSGVFLYGVEVNAANGGFPFLMCDQASCVHAGVDYDRAAVRPFAAGLAPGRDSWTGYGLTVLNQPSSALSALERFRGFLASNRKVQVESAIWRLFGASIVTTSASDAQALDVAAQSQVQVAGYAPAPNLLFRCERDLATSATVQVRAGSRVELERTTIEKVNQGVAVAAIGDTSGQGHLPGLVALKAVVTVTGIAGATSPTHAITVAGRGEAYFSGSISLSGFGAGAQLAVRKSAINGVLIEQADASALAAAGDALPTAGVSDGRHGWIVRR